MKSVVLSLGIVGLAGVTLGQTAQLTLPAEPGVYVEAASGFTRIIGQIAEFRRTGSTLVSHATVGIKSVKENIQLLGPHAQTVVSPQPVFYFVPAKQEADAGVNAGDLILVRLEEKPERRQFEIAARGLGRASSGISLTHQVQLFRTEVATGVYRIAPAGALSEGEYALYLSRGEGMAPYLVDFRVQAVVQSLPTRQEPTTPIRQTAPHPPTLSAADFGSRPHVAPSPSQVFKDATIGVFCDGNPDVHHDGVRLTAISPGGPADQAGIRAGDTILAINEHYLFTIRELQEEISRHEPASQITVRYRRYSAINEASLVVGRIE